MCLTVRGGEGWVERKKKSNETSRFCGHASSKNVRGPARRSSEDANDFPSSGTVGFLSADQRRPSPGETADGSVRVRYGDAGGRFARSGVR